MSDRSIEILQAARQNLVNACDEAAKRIENLQEQMDQQNANIAKWQKQLNDFDNDIATLAK